MTNRVQIGDLRIGPDERAALERVIDSGRISEGREVREFEEQFAAWLGVPYCVAVSSGTAALMVGLKALECAGYAGAGDRILLPALTFISTANAVTLTGFEPIFGDIDIDNFTLIPAEVARRECEHILPVHLFGYPANIDDIIHYTIKSSERKCILEDACESHGTTMAMGQKTGTMGTWGAFSFYVAHTIQAGEFGALVTPNAKIAEIAKQLRAHGRMCHCHICTRQTTGCPILASGRPDPRFQFEHIGWNFKPLEFCAALAKVQLAKFAQNYERRQQNVYTLNKLLEPLSDKLCLPPFVETVSYMVYPLVLRNSGAERRDTIIRRLELSGIEARPAFGCIPTQQPAYAKYKAEYVGTLPIAEYVGEAGFYVGCHQYLEKEDLEHIRKAVMDAVSTD